MLWQPAYSSSATTQAVGRLEHAADASAIEPSTCKQEDKASCQLLLHGKKTSRTHEYNKFNEESTRRILKEHFPDKNDKPN